jgi:hypothetical protein
MPLLTAPFPNNDPLGLTQVMRAGISDFNRNLAMGTEIAQRQAEIQMKMSSQILGDIQDSLWKKREADRRDQAMHFDMQMELRKLRMQEEDMAYKREHAYDKWNPDLNPLYGHQVAAAEALTKSREAGIPTPEEKATEAAAKELDFRKKTMEVAGMEREQRYASAATTEAQATEILASTPDLSGLSGVKLPGWIPGGQIASPLLEGYNSQRAEITAAQQQAASEKKMFAPLPTKPVTEKEPSFYERKAALTVQFEPLRRRVEGLEKQVDEAVRVHKAAKEEAAKARAEITKFKADPMSHSDKGKKDLQEMEAREKELLRKEQELAKVKLRGLDNKPAELPVTRAEEFVSKQYEEMARLQAEEMKQWGKESPETTVGTSASAKVRTNMPLPSEPPDDLETPLLPSVRDLGLDPAAADLVSRMISP